MAGGGHIIIRDLIANPETTSEEKRVLQEIVDRSPVQCSRADAWKVASIVFSACRRPKKG